MTTLFKTSSRTAGAAAFDNRILNGRIAEVVVFKSAVSAANANKVESYLALKYGITLRQMPAARNYVDSGDAVIWDATANATHNNNIAGIGRDAASVLEQKQSRSVNTANSGNLVTIGVGGIAVDNAANANTFGADRDFLTWGDNGLATTFSTLLAAPAGQNASRMLRAWRTQETGTIGTVMVGVPSTLGVGTPLHLVVSNDATFDATDTWVPTAPFSPDGLTTYLAATANFTSGQFFTFATVPPLDFGDAPASSATLLVNDGARHAVPGYDGGSHTAPLMLGALIDVEADGQPGPAASADDTADVDDEDGVVFPALVAGQAASVAVTVTNSGPAARLSAWADWNGNGSFADAGEQIVTNLAVVSGPNAVPVVPPASVNGAIIFRFRLSTQTGLGSTGIASDGEVEDYQVLVGSVTDLAITKTDSQSSYVSGAPISYTIVVTNAGPSLASGVVVNDIVPAAITGVTASCSATGTASCGTNGSSGNNVSFTAASLGAGAGNQLTITIAGIVDPSTSGNLANTVTVAAASDPQRGKQQRNGYGYPGRRPCRSADHEDGRARCLRAGHPDHLHGERDQRRTVARDGAEYQRSAARDHHERHRELRRDRGCDVRLERDGRQHRVVHGCQGQRGDRRCPDSGDLGHDPCGRDGQPDEHGTGVCTRRVGLQRSEPRQRQRDRHRCARNPPGRSVRNGHRWTADIRPRRTNHLHGHRHERGTVGRHGREHERPRAGGDHRRDRELRRDGNRLLRCQYHGWQQRRIHRRERRGRCGPSPDDHPQRRREPDRERCTCTYRDGQRRCRRNGHDAGQQQRNRYRQFRRQALRREWRRNR